MKAKIFSQFDNYDIVCAHDALHNRFNITLAKIDSNQKNLILVNKRNGFQNYYKMRFGEDFNKADKNKSS